jgi:hypothetical protein
MLREALTKMGICSSVPSTDPTADKLRRLFPSCVVCGKSLAGHRYLQLAASFNESTIAEMFRLLRNHEWKQLSAIDEWNPESNALVVYAILGPHEKNFAASIKSPHEFLESNEVYTVEELSIADTADVEAVTRSREWKPM